MASSTVQLWYPQVTEFDASDTTCFIWNNTEYCTSGDYTQVFQTQYGCDSIVTLHLTITDVGINSYPATDITHISAYPNPANDFIHIKIDNESKKISNAEIYDAVGKRIKALQWSDANSEQRVILNGLSQGFYYIRLYNHNEFLGSIKIVKK